MAGILDSLTGNQQPVFGANGLLGQAQGLLSPRQQYQPPAWSNAVSGFIGLPQQVGDWYRQKQAEMAAMTPMQRAVAQAMMLGTGASGGEGEGILAYHGTGVASRVGTLRPNMYFSEDPALASDHAFLSGPNPAVYPVRLNLKNPAPVNNISKLGSDPTQIAKLKAAGHDGAVATTYRGRVFVAFDPASINLDPIRGK